MPFPFTCPHCRTTMQVSEDFAGQSGPCAICAKTITIPPLKTARPSVAPSLGPGAQSPAPAAISAAAPAFKPVAQQHPPAQTPKSTDPSAGFISISGGLGILAAVAVAIVLAVALAVPLLAVSRPLLAVTFGSVHSTGCATNLRKIGIAMQAYHKQYGSYPPAYVTDAQGRPMHSWRVLLLPFLGPAEQSTYALYNFNEPWDGPNNLQLAGQVPDVYRCPANTRLGSAEMSYRVVVGPRTCFPGATTTKESDVLDGSAETILVVEAYNDSAIAWTQPVELDMRNLQLTINGGAGEEIGGQHRGGVHVLTADYQVRFLSDNAPPQALHAGLTRDGGDVPPPGLLSPAHGP